MENKSRLPKDILEKVSKDPNVEPIFNRNKNNKGNLNMPKRNGSIHPAVSIFIVFTLSAALGGYVYYLWQDMPEGAYITLPSGAQRAVLTEDEDDLGLTEGDSIEEIERDLDQITLDDLEEELNIIEKDIEEAEL